VVNCQLGGDTARLPQQPVLASTSGSAGSPIVVSKAMIWAASSTINYLRTAPAWKHNRNRGAPLAKYRRRDVVAGVPEWT
jgi:hypothetical protein